MSYAEKRARLYPKQVTKKSLAKAVRALSGQTLSKSRRFASKRMIYQESAGTPEQKYAITAINLAQVNSTAGTPIVTLLNGLVQGSDASNRVGNKVVFKSMYYQFGIQEDLSALGTMQENADTVLVSIVYDRQPNGALPTYATIFKVAGNNSDPYALPDPNYKDRFVILSQETFCISSGGPNGVAGQRRFQTLNLPTKFNNTTAAITSIVSGSILLCAVAQSATSDVRLVGNIRLNYEDA